MMWYSARNCFPSMIITWHGEGCFRLQNGDVSVLIDPPRDESGVSAPRFRPNLLVKTLTKWPNAYENEGADFVVHGSGEYDVSSIVVRGFSLSEESGEHFFKTAYLMQWDSLSIGLLGHLSGQLPPHAKENLEDIDVLIGPAGGDPFLSVDAMVTLVKQLNPKIFIPSFLAFPGLKRKTISIKECAQKFNGGDTEEAEKFVFKKKDLADIKKTRLICLKG